MKLNLDSFSRCHQAPSKSLTNAETPSDFYSVASLFTPVCHSQSPVHTRSLDTETAQTGFETTRSNCDVGSYEPHAASVKSVCSMPQFSTQKSEGGNCVMTVQGPPYLDKWSCLQRATSDRRHDKIKTDGLHFGACSHSSS